MLKKKNSTLFSFIIFIVFVFVFFFFWVLSYFNLFLHQDTTLAELEKQKKLDEWLPVTASRKAKWWYSAFHNVTAMVGAGVLGLPFAMSQLGWYKKMHYLITHDIVPAPLIFDM